MRQRRFFMLLWLVALLALGMAVGLGLRHRRPDSRPVTQPTAVYVEPRVASSVPAATDLLLGIGAGNHLVGVSYYDDDRLAGGRPKIGDYQSIDWEKLIAGRAQVLVTQYSPGRIPSGLEDRCRQLGIEIVNIRLNSLDDVFVAMKQLGAAVHTPEAAAVKIADIQTRLEAIRQGVVNLPKIKTVLVTGEDGRGLAGAGTYLDELLTIAGGENAAAPLGQPYPTVDREQLMALAPEVVIQLIPDGDQTPQVLEQAKQVWAAMPNLPAVKARRVYTITDWYATQPGSHVAELAEKFAAALHPTEATP